MRCDDEADVARAFERLRSQTEAYVFSQVGRITLSVGLSEVQPGGSPSVAIERADHAVNFVKGRGRNQVHSHAALVARGELKLSRNGGEMELF